jgi:hypothetical protein
MLFFPVQISLFKHYTLKKQQISMKTLSDSPFNRKNNFLRIRTANNINSCKEHESLKTLLNASNTTKKST